MLAVPIHTGTRTQARAIAGSLRPTLLRAGSVTGESSSPCAEIAVAWQDEAAMGEHNGDPGPPRARTFRAVARFYSSSGPLPGTGNSAEESTLLIATAPYFAAWLALSQLINRMEGRSTSSNP